MIVWYAAVLCDIHTVNSGQEIVEVEHVSRKIAFGPNLIEKFLNSYIILWIHQLNHIADSADPAEFYCGC